MTNVLNKKWKNIMENKFELGQQVVRSKGDYVVGRIGIIIEIDNQKNRARVDWIDNPKTWVSFTVIEPTSIPYYIIHSKQKSKYVLVHPKHQNL